MKMLKTLIVSVLLVAQVSAVSTSNTRKTPLCKSIRRLEFNLGLLKKKSQPKVSSMSKIGTTIKNNKGKIALGVGLITLGVLAYQNPAFVTNVVSTAKDCFNLGLSKVANFLVGKKVEIAEQTNNLLKASVKNEKVINWCYKILPNPNGVFAGIPFENGEHCMSAEVKRIFEWQFGLKRMKESMDYAGVTAKFVS